jgi:hypothetical protein
VFCVVFANCDDFGGSWPIHHRMNSPRFVHGMPRAPMFGMVTKSIKVHVLSIHGDFVGMVEATSKRAAVVGMAKALGLPYRLIDRSKYVRAVSCVGSLDPAWFNIEA